MENRNRDRDNLDKKRQRESGLPGTSSQGSESDRGNMDRSTHGKNIGSPSGSQSPSSNVGSPSGSSGSRSRDDESEIGSPGRSSDR